MAASCPRWHRALLAWLAFALVLSGPLAVHAQATDEAVTVVSDSEALKKAYKDNAKLIKLTNHVELTTDPNDPNAPASVTWLEADNASYAVWGECSTPLDPAIYDEFKVPPQYRSPTACGMAIGPDDNAFLLAGGRLLVSNIVVYSLLNTPKNRMYTATYVYKGATMWMVNTVVAGPLGYYGNSVPLAVEDAKLYVVNSAVTDINVRSNDPASKLYYGCAAWLTAMDPKQARGVTPMLGLSGSYFQADFITQYMGPVYAEIHDAWGDQPVALVYNNNTVVGKSLGERQKGWLPPTCGNGTVICTKYAHFSQFTSDDFEPWNPVKKSDPATGFTVFSDLPPENITSDVSGVLIDAPVSALPAELATVPAEDAAWLQSLKLLGVPGIDEALDPFGLAEAPPPAADPVSGPTAQPQPAPAPGVSNAPLIADEVQPRDGGGDGINRDAAISGGVIGGAVLLACIVFVALALKRRRRASSQFSSSRPEYSHPMGISVSQSHDTSGYEDHAFSWSVNNTLRTMPTSNFNVPPSNITMPPSTDISFTPQKAHATKTGVIDVSSETFLTSTGPVVSESTTQLSRVQDARNISEGLLFVRAQISSVIKSGQGLIFGNYILDPVEDMRAGGQGIVYFASAEGQVAQKLALKFFASERAFLNEQVMYEKPSLRGILPPLKEIISNHSSAWKDPRGKPIAPCIIMEKGEALNSWAARSAPDIITALQVMCHVMRAVMDLHAAGLVHRDLKPSNTLWLPSQNRWTIMDFGSTAEAGTSALLSVTLAYAAPESVLALRNGQHMVMVSTALDVWSLGIMALELFSGSRAVVGKKTEIIAALTGDAPLPWEVPGPDLDAKLAKLGAMRPAVLAMLNRDPSKRPALPDVYSEWTGIFGEN